MKIATSGQLRPRNHGAPAHDRGLQANLAKRFLHPVVPPVVAAVQAVRLDAVEHFHGVTGSLGYLRARSPSVQPCVMSQEVGRV
jgi:hypothetical protein